MAKELENRGTGHPNKILQKDYAGRDPKIWFVRVETMVHVEDDRLDEVRKWLESGTSNEKLAKYLVGRVPDTAGAKGKQDAQHMIFAAFGLEHPKNGSEAAAPR
jgi:hypothetical protein